MSVISGKNVLVTGGSGSIGSELVRQLLRNDPESVRILDNNEEGLFSLNNSLPTDEDTLRFLLGDVRDRDRLKMAMEDIDIVFHAAALKHVELNEYNPFEAVQTNVDGTQNLIRMALEEEVESFVGISTDKASNPTSVMGATKLLSERLITAANTYKGNRSTRFGCVRFGNVLGSSGSVVPLFLDQISDGGPITVTDPEMTRFIMPLERAVELVFEAHQRISGGEVFVLKMPSFRVGTLAKAMRSRYASEFGFGPDDIDIEIIGRRPGERTHEKLISHEEMMQTKEMDEMFVIVPQIKISGYEHSLNGDENSLDGEYVSSDADILNENDIVALIEESQTFGTDGR